jgi:serine protease
MNSLEYSNNFSHIVGGENIKGHKSWMASMQINGKSLCGAMLIAPQWVISASHCTIPANMSDIVIKLGGVDLNNDDEFESFTVVEKIEHPTFDAVLLKLSSPSKLSKPIKINNNNKLPTGLVTKAIGWGKMGENGSTSDILQTVDLPLVSDDECYRTFGSKFNNNSMICAGYKQGMKDACQGDSGGPLFTETPKGDVLIGATSWGEGCARAGVYGVWTRLSKLNEWIDNNIDHKSLKFADAANGHSRTMEKVEKESKKVKPNSFVEKCKSIVDNCECSYSHWIIIILLILILIKLN